MKVQKITVILLAVLALAAPTALVAADQQQTRERDQLRLEDCDTPECLQNQHKNNPAYRNADPPNAQDPAMEQNRNRHQSQHQTLSAGSGNQGHTSGGSGNSTGSGNSGSGKSGGGKAGSSNSGGGKGGRK